MPDYFASGKKAQIGETMTWLVATLVIVVILGLSILALSAFRIISNKSLNFNLDRTADLLAAKSFVSYLSTTQENGKTIYDNLKEGGKPDTVLEKKIEGFYSGNYQTTGGTYGISVCNSDPNDYTCSNGEFGEGCQIFYRVYLSKDGSRFAVLCFRSK
jgi:hypothetical protein